MTEEQQQIHELARDFARSELRPGIEAWDRDRTMPAEVVGHLAELGFFGMTLPESDGGMGFDLPTFLVAVEALGWGEPAVALTVAYSAMTTRLLLDQGSAEQRERWFGAVASGEGLIALALGGADSDAAADSLPVRATRDGDGWVLEGELNWVSNGASARAALVLARTDAGPALFLVPTDAGGYVTGERHTTMGLRALEVVPVTLERVRVGGGALVGTAGSAMDAVRDALVVGRLAVASIAVGIGQAALEHAVAYADERKQFGRSIREFEAIQFKLADIATSTAAARALTRAAAATPDPRNAAEAKLFAAEAAMRTSTEAVQVFGGYGYMRDYPVEKLMRDAKAMELLEGTNDALRVTIAGELYRS